MDVIYNKLKFATWRPRSLRIKPILRTPIFQNVTLNYFWNYLSVKGKILWMVLFVMCCFRTVPQGCYAASTSPSFMLQPTLAHLRTLPGSNVTLSCQITTLDLESLLCLWRTPYGQTYSINDDVELENGRIGPPTDLKCGLNIRRVELKDGGVWECEMGTLMNGSFVTSTASIALEVKGELQEKTELFSTGVNHRCFDEQITKCGTGIRVKEVGEAITLDCSAKYQVRLCRWKTPYLNTYIVGSGIFVEKGRIQWMPPVAPNASNCSIKIASLELRDAGKWICEIGADNPAGKFGIRTQDFDVKVESPLTISSPTSLMQKANTEATLVCHVNKPYSKCTWTSPLGTDYEFPTSEGENYEGGRISFFRVRQTDCGILIKGVKAGDNGQWQCTLNAINENLFQTSTESVELVSGTFSTPVVFNAEKVGFIKDEIMHRADQNPPSVVSLKSRGLSVKGGVHQDNKKHLPLFQIMLPPSKLSRNLLVTKRKIPNRKISSSSSTPAFKKQSDVRLTGVDALELELLYRISGTHSESRPVNLLDITHLSNSTNEKDMLELSVRNNLKHMRPQFESVKIDKNGRVLVATTTIGNIIQAPTTTTIQAKNRNRIITNNRIRHQRVRTKTEELKRLSQSDQRQDIMLNVESEMTNNSLEVHKRFKALAERRSKMGGEKQLSTQKTPPRLNFVTTEKYKTQKSLDVKSQKLNGIINVTREESKYTNKFQGALKVNDASNRNSSREIKRVLKPRLKEMKRKNIELKNIKKKQNKKRQKEAQITRNNTLKLELDTSTIAKEEKKITQKPKKILRNTLMRIKNQRQSTTSVNPILLKKLEEKQNLSKDRIDLPHTGKEESRRSCTISHPNKGILKCNSTAVTRTRTIVPSGETCSLTCNTGYVSLKSRESQCLPSGIWSERLDCVRPDALMLIGGRADSQGILNSIELITERGVCRGAVPPIPVMRWRMISSAISKNHIITCGGADVFGDSKSDCWLLSLSGKHPKWEEAPSMAEPHDAAAWVQEGNSLYILGGTQGKLARHTKIVEVLDIGAKNWRRGTPMTSPRYSHCAVGLGNGSLITTGGYGGLGLVERLDIEHGVWTLLAELNPVRAQHSCALVELRGQQGIMVVGGDSGGTRLKDVRFLPTNVQGNGWLKVSELSIARWARPGLGVVGGRITVAAGWDGLRDLDTVEYYDEKSSTWRLTKSTLQTARRWASYTPISLRLFPKCAQKRN